MKILFVTPSYKPATIYGGTIVVTAELAECLVELGHDVTVYTTTANGSKELDEESGALKIVAGVGVKYFSRITGDPTHASPALMYELHKTLRDFDIVHIHSWWNLVVVGAAWMCMTKGIRPVLSPHGMFSDYILTARNQKKKRLLHSLIGRKLLANTILHVSSDMERMESQRLITNWKCEIIPNLVRLPNRVYLQRRNDVFTVGFLSRIDPKKGVDILIRALSSVGSPYKLVIAGTGPAEYVNSLVELSKECGNEDRMEWVGWKDGNEKFSFLASLDLFALTSHSENFAVVVIEALAVGTPVLVSDGVGLHSYVSENDCGWVSGIEDVASTFHSVFANTEKREKIRRLAPSMIQKDFSRKHLAEQYLKLYESVNELNSLHA